MMTGAAIVEYIVNSAWQIPLLALGAWALIKIVRPGARVEHWVWLAVLAMAVVLPVRATKSKGQVRATASARLERTESAGMEDGIGHPAREVSQPSQTAWQGVTGAKGMVLSASATRWVVGCYAVTVLLGMLRLARAWGNARRLIKESLDVVLPATAIRELERCSRELHVRPPKIRESCAISGPVVVGAMRPVLLLPERFANHAEDEVRAALLHELAHVRRRDYLVNLVCQMAALPVAWHPAAWAVQQRIRVTREMVCDEMAAAGMGSSVGYARCLVALAQEMLIGGARTQALELFERGTMEERVVRLTVTDMTAKVNGRAKLLRGAAGVAAMLAVTVAATMFHVRPTFAATAVTAPDPAETGSAAQGRSSSAAPGAVVAPAEFQAKLTEVAFQAKLSGVKTGRMSGPLQHETGASHSSPATDDEPTATAGEGEYVHRWIGNDGKKYVVVNRDPKEPAAEERLKEEQQLRTAQKQLVGMKVHLDAAKLNRQMEELQKKLAKIGVEKTLDKAEHLLDDSKMEAQMNELDEKLNDPALQKQFSDIDKKLNDPAWQKQFTDLEKNATLKAMNDPKLRRELSKMEENARAMSAEAQAVAARAIDAQMKAQMVEAQKEIKSGALKTRLDAAQKMLDEARKQMQEFAKK